MEVHIYFGVNQKNSKISEKKYGYVMECVVRGKTVTKQGFGSIVGTYHQATLVSMIDALKRMKVSCKIYLHTEDSFVLDMMAVYLSSWALYDFYNVKGKPIANQNEWRRIWPLTKGHQIIYKKGQHEYSEWLKSEINRINRSEETV